MEACAFTGIQLRDVIILKNLCFILPYEYSKTVKHSHTGERFWKDAFLVTVSTRHVWTEGQTEEK